MPGAHLGMRPRTFPFVPKSSVTFEPGDYWGIPLDKELYACGRVLQHMPKGMAGARVGFLGGLLNWQGREAPSSESIAGAKTLEQGVMHVLAIKKTGGEVLGHRPLHLDGLEPWVFIHGAVIQRGFTEIGRCSRGDARRLPALSWWGYDVIEVLARKHFRVDSGGGA